MFLIHRPAFPADLAECRDCLPDGSAYTDADRRDLIRAWSLLLNTGAGTAAVMEDLAAPPGRRIMWFGFKAFVRDDYLSWLHRAPPMIGRELLRACRDGCCPVLTAEEVRDANSQAGLNMVCFHSGCPREALANGFLEHAGACMMEFQAYFYGGYRLKSYHIEMYGEAMWAWAAGSGLRLRNDHAGHCAAEDGPRARLYGITRGEARAAPGTFSEVLFNYSPPRFGFTRTQREILNLALTAGDTDEQIASRLGLAPVSVKKTWMGAYARVTRADPGFFAAQTAARDAIRGPEKKRWLLTYLRQHMEELRPHRETHQPHARPPAERAAAGMGAFPP